VTDVGDGEVDAAKISHDLASKYDACVRGGTIVLASKHLTQRVCVAKKCSGEST
jgi:hypothetical protein